MRANYNFRGRGRSRSRGGRGGFSKQRERDSSSVDNLKQRDDDQNRGNASPRGGKSRNMNPVGSNGSVLTCIACGSFRHLLSDCPDSWENLEKAYVCYSEEIELTDENDIGDGDGNNNNDLDDTEEVDVVLFTGGIKADISDLGRDTKNCMVLDSACSKTVCGKPWLYCYLDSLSKDDRKKLKFSPNF